MIQAIVAIFIVLTSPLRGEDHLGSDRRAVVSQNGSSTTLRIKPSKMADRTGAARALSGPLQQLMSTRKFGEYGPTIKDILNDENPFYCEYDTLRNLNHEARQLLSTLSPDNLKAYLSIANVEANVALQRAKSSLDYRAYDDIIYRFPRTEAAKHAYGEVIATHLDSGDFELAALYSTLMFGEYKTAELSGESIMRAMVAFAHLGDVASVAMTREALAPHLERDKVISKKIKQSGFGDYLKATLNHAKAENDKRILVPPDSVIDRLANRGTFTRPKPYEKFQRLTRLSNPKQLEQLLGVGKGVGMCAVVALADAAEMDDVAPDALRLLTKWWASDKDKDTQEQRQIAVLNMLRNSNPVNSQAAMIGLNEGLVKITGWSSAGKNDLEAVRRRVRFLATKSEFGFPFLFSSVVGGSDYHRYSRDLLRDPASKAEFFKVMEHADAEVASNAISSLIVHKAAYLDAQDILARALQHSDSRVRGAVIEDMLAHGPAEKLSVRLLKKSLRSDLANEKRNALALVEKFGFVDELMPELRLLLGDADTDVQYGAVNLALMVSDHKAELAPILVGLLDAKTLSYTNSRLIEGLSAWGHQSPAFKEKLLALCNESTDVVVIAAALAALNAFRDQIDGWLALNLRMLNGGGPIIFDAAVKNLAQLKGHEKEVIGSLIEKLGKVQGGISLDEPVDTLKNQMLMLPDEFEYLTKLSSSTREWWWRGDINEDVFKYISPNHTEKVDDWLSRLKDEELSRYDLGILAGFGDEVIEPLVAVIKSGPKQARNNALYTISLIAPTSTKARQTLTMLGTNPYNDGELMARWFSTIGSMITGYNAMARDVVGEMVIRAYLNSTPENRRHMLSQFSYGNTPNDAMLAVSAGMLKNNKLTDDEIETLSTLMERVSSSHADSIELRKLYTELLDHDNPLVRQKVAVLPFWEPEDLRDLQVPQQKALIASLEEALNRKDYWVPLFRIETLQLGTPSMVKKSISVLTNPQKQPSPQLVSAAVSVTSNSKEQSDDAISALLKHVDWTHQIEIVEALGKLRAKKAVPKLKQIMERGASSHHRLVAMQALLRIEGQSVADEVRAQFEEHPINLFEFSKLAQVAGEQNLDPKPWIGPLEKDIGPRGQVDPTSSALALGALGQVDILKNAISNKISLGYAGLGSVKQNKQDIANWIVKSIPENQDAAWYALGALRKLNVPLPEGAGSFIGRSIRQNMSRGSNDALDAAIELLEQNPSEIKNAQANLADLLENEKYAKKAVQLLRSLAPENEDLLLFGLSKRNGELVAMIEALEQPEISNPKIKAELLKIATGREPQASIAALRAIAQTPTPNEEVTEALRRGLSSDYPIIRSAAVNGLIKQGELGAAVLESDFTTSAPMKQVQILKSMSQQQGTAANLQEIAYMGLQQPDPRVKDAAIDYLSKNASDKPRLNNELKSIIEKDRYRYLKLRAQEALEAIQSPPE